MPLLEKLTLPQGEAVGEREREAHPVPLALWLLVTELVGDGVPLSDPVAQAVLLAQGVGERVGVGHTVAVPEALADPEEERHLEGVGLTEGLMDAVGEPVASPLPEKDAVAQPLPEGVALPQRLAVPQADAEGDWVAVAQSVALPLRLLAALLDAHRLPLTDAVLQGVPLAQGDVVRVAEAHTDTVGEPLAEPVEDRQREGEGEAEALAEGHRVPEPHPLAVGDAVLQPLPELVPLLEELAVAQGDAVGERLLEAQPDPLAL